MKKGKYFTGKTMPSVWLKGIARLGLVAALLVTGLLVAVPSAQADVFNITSDESTGQNLGTPPFGTVTLTQQGTDVVVAVQLATLSPSTNGYFFAKTGAVADQAFVFNTTATNLVFKDFLINNSSTSLLVASNNSGAGFTSNPLGGTFDYGISDPTQGGGLSGPLFNMIGFTVENVSISQLIDPLPNGTIFGADIGRLDGPVTGAANVTGTAVPEPASMLLLGFGLLGVAGVRRMLKK